MTFFVKAGSAMGKSIKSEDTTGAQGSLEIIVNSKGLGQSFKIFQEENRIMDEAKAYMLGAIYNPAFVVDAIDNFKIGVGGTSTLGGTDTLPVPGDRVDLYDPYTSGYSTAMPTPSTSIDGKTVTFTFSIADTDMNGVYINEVAMFRNSGTIFNMKTFPSILKTSGFSLTFIWTIRHK